MASQVTRAVNKFTSQSAVRAMVRYGQLAVLYLLLIFALPGNKQVMQLHNLSTYEYHILQLLIGLPLLVVWFTAFYGYSKLEIYTESIRRSPEALGFKRLTQGCTWIAWSLPIHAITSLLSNTVSDNHSGFGAAVIIVGNYVDTLLPVVAFTLIGLASRQLFDQAKITLSGISIRGITTLFLLGGVLYCYLVFRQFSGAGLSSTHNPYHMPIWISVLTLIVPYLYAWFAGLLAVYELIAYGRQVKGVLYRQAVHMLELGLLAMIFGSIAAQFARSAQLSAEHLLFNTPLVFNLIFQFISGLGFVMIALGAMRLKKIEEV